MTRTTPRSARPRTGPSPPPVPAVNLSWVIEDVAVLRPSLMIDETATAQNIARVRREFATWLAVDLAPGNLLDDLILAVYEALANVSDHAYTDTPAGVGAPQLTAHRAHESLRITISDRGRWCPTTNRRSATAASPHPPTHRAGPHRDHGLRHRYAPAHPPSCTGGARAVGGTGCPAVSSASRLVKDLPGNGRPGR
jgi:anti-sigma regulatory factor (Ser/Thr protein kinase)